MVKFYFKFFLYLSVLILFSPARAGAYEDFFRAVNVDNALTVKELLERGFDPNTLSEKGQFPLYLALRDRSPKVASLLMTHPQTRLDAANAAGETPLMMAALRGDIAATLQLLERGAALNREGWTPLHYAATGPEPKLVELLLERGAAIDAPSPNRSTPLMLACRYGPEGAVDALLRRGASLQLKNDVGMNAVDFARSAGREALTRRLANAAR
jgi:ankyrin repeat protein